MGLVLGVRTNPACGKSLLEQLNQVINSSDTSDAVLGRLAELQASSGVYPATATNAGIDRQSRNLGIPEESELVFTAGASPYAENAKTVGKGIWQMGESYSHVNYTTLDGSSLEEFLTENDDLFGAKMNRPGFPGGSQP